MPELNSTEFTGFVGKEEKVIISDLLYYLFHKFNREPQENVISACLNFAPYTETAIFDEKQKFFLAIDKNCIARRADKRAKDLEDILAMAQRDASGDSMPTFVSSNMSNIPWTPDGDATNSQILSSIHDLKNSAVTKEMLNVAISSLRNEILTRPTHEFLPPPPLGTPKRLLPDVPKSPLLTLAKTVTPLREKQVEQRKTTSSPRAPSAQREHDPVDAVGVGFWSTVARGRMASSTSKATDSQPKTQHRSRSKTIIGKKVSDGSVSWKGADLTVNRYIGNVDITAKSDQIRDYIEKKGITVIEFEENKTQHTRFKSFRLRIRRSDVTNIDNPEFWPSDVIVRPFFRPRQNQNKDGASGSDGPRAMPFSTS